MKRLKPTKEGLWENLKDFISYRKAKKLMYDVNKLSNWEAKIVEEGSYRGREVRIEPAYSFEPANSESLAELFDLLGKFSTKFKISYYAYYREHNFKVSVEIGG